MDPWAEPWGDAPPTSSTSAPPPPTDSGPSFAPSTPPKPSLPPIADQEFDPWAAPDQSPIRNRNFTEDSVADAASSKPRSDPAPAVEHRVAWDPEPSPDRPTKTSLSGDAVAGTGTSSSQEAQEAAKPEPAHVDDDDGLIDPWASNPDPGAAASGIAAPPERLDNLQLPSATHGVASSSLAPELKLRSAPDDASFTVPHDGGHQSLDAFSEQDPWAPTPPANVTSGAPALSSAALPTWPSSSGGAIDGDANNATTTRTLADLAQTKPPANRTTSAAGSASYQPHARKASRSQTSADPSSAQVEHSETSNSSEANQGWEMQKKQGPAAIAGIVGGWFSSAVARSRETPKVVNAGAEADSDDETKPSPAQTGRVEGDLLGAQNGGASGPSTSSPDTSSTSAAPTKAQNSVTGKFWGRWGKSAQESKQPNAGAAGNALDSVTGADLDALGAEASQKAGTSGPYSAPLWSDASETSTPRLSQRPPHARISSTSRGSFSNRTKPGLHQTTFGSKGNGPIEGDPFDFSEFEVPTSSANFSGGRPSSTYNEASHGVSSLARIAPGALAPPPSVGPRSDQWSSPPPSGTSATGLMARSQSLSAAGQSGRYGGYGRGGPSTKGDTFDTGFWEGQAKEDDIDAIGHDYREDPGDQDVFPEEWGSNSNEGAFVDQPPLPPSKPQRSSPLAGRATSPPQILQRKEASQGSAVGETRRSFSPASLGTITLNRSASTSSNRTATPPILPPPPSGSSNRRTSVLPPPPGPSRARPISMQSSGNSSTSGGRHGLAPSLSAFSPPPGQQTARSPITAPSGGSPQLNAPGVANKAPALSQGQGMTNDDLAFFEGL